MIKTTLANLSLPTQAVTYLPNQQIFAVITPSLSIYSLAQYLSNPAAIDALLQLNDEHWLTALTANPHLSPTQLSTLLSSSSDKLTARIAMRRDLPLELIWQIVKDPRKHLRHGFLFEQDQPFNRRVTLPADLIEYIMGQDWFSPAFARRLLNFNGLTSKQIKECNKKLRRATYSQAYAANHSPEHTFFQIIKSQQQKDEYPVAFINDTIHVTDALQVPLPLFLETAAPACHPGNKLLELSILAPFQELTAHYGLEFFTTLFSLIDGWQYSLSDLIDVTASLTPASSICTTSPASTVTH